MGGPPPHQRPCPPPAQRRLHTPCHPLASHWIQVPISHGTFSLIDSLGSALLPPITPRADLPGLTVSSALCLQARSGGG